MVIGGTPPYVEDIVQAIAASGKPVEALVLDDCEHDAITLTERGTASPLRIMRDGSRARRTRVELGELCLGMECGRSDPSSGLVCQSARGHIVDAVDRGRRSCRIRRNDRMARARSICSRSAQSIRASRARFATRC